MRMIRHGAFWVSCAATLLLFTVAIWSVWTGTCTDYVSGGGTCTYEPAVGAAGAVVLSIIAVAGAVVCIMKAVKVKAGRRAA